MHIVFYLHHYPNEELKGTTITRYFPGNKVSNTPAVFLSRPGIRHCSASGYSHIIGTRMVAMVAMLVGTNWPQKPGECGEGELGNGV
jgi:hypothetical protein